MYKNSFFRKASMIFILTGTILFLNSGCIKKKTVSIESLLIEMVDRSSLARFPDPVFVTKQFSSYDRRSVEKDQPSWFANRDHGGWVEWTGDYPTHLNFVRIDSVNGRREFVMMDAEGSGAIVRFWTTFAGKNSGRGILRIYVDDYSVPAIEGTAFDILSGDALTTPPLATSVSELTPYEQRGHNLYFPIPYSKRCKVTYESDNLHEVGPDRTGTEAIYYVINYRDYKPGAKVIPWSPSEMEKNQALITNVQKRLADKERGVVEKARIDLNANLKPQESKSFTLSGSNAIEQLAMEIKADDKEQALRSTVLEIAFDGERTVWTPVGDFYGIGYHSLYTSTWYTQAEKDGLMSAFWVMPFKRECVITLHNFGDQEVTVTNAFVSYNDWKWDNRSMYFGAAWQQYTGVVAGPSDEAWAFRSHSPPLDLNYVTLQGKGVYVGDALAIFNTRQDSWWGEGDEKIYVDGEEFPSHFGTGTEDYYGYAWCLPAAFTDHPFIAQPVGEGSFNVALTVNSRFRALDGIPFHKSIQVDMELWPWYIAKFNFAPVVMWYAMPEVSVNISPRPEDARLPVARSFRDVSPTHYEKGIIEGEDMFVSNKTGGNLSSQSAHGFGWSDNMCLFWGGGAVGDEITLHFFMKEGGKFNVKAAFCVSYNYGIFSISLNGKQALSRLMVTIQR